MIIFQVVIGDLVAIAILIAGMITFVMLTDVIVENEVAGEKTQENLTLELRILAIQDLSWEVMDLDVRKKIRRHLVDMPRTIEAVEACEKRVNEILKGQQK